MVRNGHAPRRTILTGLGPIEVAQPRVLDLRPADEAEPFSSKFLPPYLRRTKSVDELIPWLYLKGVSSSDFSEALAALVGPQAAGLSASTVVRLKSVWEDESSSGTSDRWSASSTCTCWSTGSISTFAWRKIGNAFWC